MKLSFFPTPLPDESLSSILMRYYHLTAPSTIFHSFNALFGEVGRQRTSRRDLLSITLYRHINTLAERMPGDTQENLEKLYRDHTLSALDHFATGEYFTRDLYFIRQFTGSGTRTCEQCMQEDSITYGILYWHRSHQIYDVGHCWKHGSELIEKDPFDNSIRPGHFITSKNKKYKFISERDMRLKYAIVMNHIINTPQNINSPHLVSKVIDYKIWKSRAVKTPYLAWRIAQLNSIHKRRSTLVTERHRSIEIAPITISMVFKNPQEYEKYRDCGVLNPSNAHPKIFQKENPGINWKWVYRYEALYKIESFGTKNPDSPERKWLEKYDSKWMKKLEKLESRPNAYSQAARDEFYKFRYDTTYISRL